MKLTREVIENVFQYTTYKHNGLDLDIIFKNGYQTKEMQFEGYEKFTSWGDRYNLVYEILKYMNSFYPQLGFGQIFLHSDGGMQDYMITYKRGDYTVILSRETHLGNETQFKSVDDFVDWLNGHVEKINAQFKLSNKKSFCPTCGAPRTYGVYGLNPCCVDAGDEC